MIAKGEIAAMLIIKTLRDFAETLFYFAFIMK